METLAIVESGGIGMLPLENVSHYDPEAKQEEQIMDTNITGLSAREVTGAP